MLSLYVSTYLLLNTRSCMFILIISQLPYLNWDTYENFTRLRDTYNVGPEVVSNSPESIREGLQQNVSSKYLNHDPPLHPRRSLDQFYYSSLSDTRERDADQTVSKWTGSRSKIAEDGRDEAERDSLIVMVDQLWVWVLNERKFLWRCLISIG